MSPGSLQFMPAQTPEVLDALRSDIAEHGVQVPVVVDQHGRILDGNNRAAIATELGIEYPTEIVHVADEDEAEDRAIALNLKRRTITQAQMRELIEDQLKRHPEMADRAIARRLGTSHPTVAAVRRGGKSFQPNADEAAKRRDDLIEIMTVLRERFATIVYFLSTNAVDPLTILRAMQDGETNFRDLTDGSAAHEFWEQAGRWMYSSLRRMLLDGSFQDETRAQYQGPGFEPMTSSDVEPLLEMLRNPRYQLKRTDGAL